ncbi:MAG TPA: arginine--tRNA ligase [Candidatus Coproplasma stercoripullorum]|uniref:Arginine--tRNA ligase n=1 Tax=Candidatus Coproplasma stercoripullorum TaxID=2840751 RepID=A0A9D1AHA9_9FIRM|nr:arginine--tRNA ligase [Candidatus Coproplasma stercoripullorum]
MDYKKHIAQKIAAEGLSEEDIYAAIALPPNSEMGDYALPCFKFAKVLRKSPALIAQDIAANYPADEVIERAEAVNGYVNFTVNKSALARETIDEVLAKGERYGASGEGAGKTICIDYSSVNIAKPFHIGHLSTTAIGGALYKIFNFLGYKAVGINHLGDYGTQFGKLICAYKHWGNREEVQAGGIHAINDLYVRFNSEATEEMEHEAREYFRLIESGDKEANELFDWFKDLTLEYVKGIYKKLNVTFDSYAGERFYTDKMGPVIDELREKGLLKESNGAQIVDLEPYGMPPCLILRSDGASLYATRDLAAAIYRKNTYDFYKCLYVVAYQQNLHFKQFFKVLELMGKEWAKDLVHVAYGMVSLEDGAMSTRKGKVVWLEDVIRKCEEKAYAIISEKNPELENKEDVAEKVGVGAVIFGALYNSKIKDIVFSYDKVLSFEGETSVYVQYTCARANSVLEKGGVPGEYKISELLPQEAEVVKAISAFPQAVKDAAEKYEPSIVARFAVDLAQKFNKFYFDCKILTAEGDKKNFRLALTAAALTALKNALALLGIGVPEKM